VSTTLAGRAGSNPVRLEDRLRTRSLSVYNPTAFAETDTTKLHEFMRRHSFAVLTSHGEDGLVASHLPLLLDADAGPHGHLLGHMARANPQWRGV
jgi:transcriptional regulator